VRASGEKRADATSRKEQHLRRSFFHGRCVSKPSVIVSLYRFELCGQCKFCIRCQPSRAFIADTGSCHNCNVLRLHQVLDCLVAAFAKHVET
jgi:hypothetical protein